MQWKRNMHRCTICYCDIKSSSICLRTCALKQILEQITDTDNRQNSKTACKVDWMIQREQFYAFHKNYVFSPWIHGSQPERVNSFYLPFSLHLVFWELYTVLLLCRWAVTQLLTLGFYGKPAECKQPQGYQTHRQSTRKTRANVILTTVETLMFSRILFSLDVSCILWSHKSFLLWC